MKMFIAIFFLGLMIGGGLTVITTHIKLIGKLHIDTSESYDRPVLYLELLEDVVNIYKVKNAKLEIITHK